MKCSAPAVSRCLLFALVILCDMAKAEPFTFFTVSPSRIQERLDRVSKDDRNRAEAVYEMFEAVGCKGDHLTRSPVRGSQTPNIVCTLPGNSEDVVVVGGHHDHSPKGDGVIDNWSGASLLASLYESMARAPRKYTYQFVSFAAEEKGLFGSYTFVQKLGKQRIPHVQAMINVDCIGLSYTRVWVSRSDKRLVQIAAAVAGGLKLEVAGIDVDGVGESDSRPFHNKKIPVLDVHSVTQEFLTVLHSPRDNTRALNMEHYLGTYKLLAALLVYLDMNFDRNTTPLVRK